MIIVFSNEPCTLCILCQPDIAARHDAICSQHTASVVIIDTDIQAVLPWINEIRVGIGIHSNLLISVQIGITAQYHVDNVLVIPANHSQHKAVFK